MSLCCTLVEGFIRVGPECNNRVGSFLDYTARSLRAFVHAIRFLCRPSSASKIASRSNCGAIELRQSFTSRTILSLSCRHPLNVLYFPFRQTTLCSNRGCGLYAAEAGVVAGGPHFTFAARADHVRVQYWSVQRNDPPRCTRFFSVGSAGSYGESGPCGLRATPPASFCRA
jgi:hypothetical protein